MQVSNTEKLSTVAVGKMESAEFTIDNSSEFFEILSKSIYQYPLVAMCRETLTNAWDGHCEAGKEETPVVVTVKDNLVSIRDYGIGLPHDLETMAKIYVTYGKGTKRDNNTVTGGFGLGCKSPLGVSDTFTVISHRDGIATMWVIAKASQNTGGKPSINKVNSWESDEVGVEVQVPVSNSDMYSCKTYLEETAWLGGMYVLINDKEIERLEVPTIGALVNKYDVKTPYLRTTLLIKYGANLYPMPERNELYKQLSDALTCEKNEDGSNVRTEVEVQQELEVFTNLMSFLDYFNNDSKHLVLQAKPDSLHLAPSRESLSMSHLTALTIRDLVFDVFDYYANPPKEDVPVLVENIKKWLLSYNINPTYELHSHSTGRKELGLREYIYLKLSVSMKAYAKLCKEVVLENVDIPDNCIKLFNKAWDELCSIGYADKHYRILMVALVRKMYKSTWSKLPADMFKTLAYMQGDYPRTAWQATDHLSEVKDIIKFLTVDTVLLYTYKKYLGDNNWNARKWAIKIPNKKADIQQAPALLGTLGINIEVNIAPPKPPVYKPKSPVDNYIYTMPKDYEDYLGINPPTRTEFKVYITEAQFSELKNQMTERMYKVFYRRFKNDICVYTDSRVHQRAAYKKAINLYEFVTDSLQTWFKDNHKEVNKLLNNCWYHYDCTGDKRATTSYGFFRDNTKVFGLGLIGDSQWGLQVNNMISLYKVFGNIQTLYKEANLANKPTKKYQKIETLLETKSEWFSEQVSDIRVLDNMYNRDIAKKAINTILKQIKGEMK